ncbi:uncharacterized protein QC764_707540 [Podospora pseudoanserina]|uniref:Uncharacterized protein n=1 Tax=Podospora pseudoanserina TaxID=2609844 RepID=A0ABR0HK57_9PEZI|nr:hypothetical protein QC764_707540 [Podospora pseudoanserina]
MASLSSTSPLITLGTTISTPSSHHTARTDGDNVGDTSALTSVDDLDDDDDQLLPPPYRDAAQLPFMIKNQLQIHLEEKMYPETLNMLHALLSNCASFSPPSKEQGSQPPQTVYVPPPHQLAFISSLAIHPRFTSAPPDVETTTPPVRDGTAALSYLRGLLSIVGPINANFRQAFEFKPPPSSSHDRRSRRGDVFGNWSTSGMSGADSDASSSDVMTGTFAREGVIWHRASDFWSVLGWSFWCAAFVPGRWKYWKPWLEFVVTVLEQDWDDRLAMDEKTTTAGDEPYPNLKGSLLVAYLEDITKARKTVQKEVMKALTFALEAGDRKVYGEVFTNEELVGPRTIKRKRANTTLDLENGCFGDYDDDDSDLENEGDSQELPCSSARSARGVQKRTKKAMESDAGPRPAAFRLPDGVAETIPFRLRIFRLLSAAAHYLRDVSFPTSELYQSFSYKIRTSPLPVFELFLKAHNDLSDVSKVLLYRNVLDGLLPPNGLPDPDRVDRDTNSRDDISALEVMLQKCFLPFPAGRITAEDNAKLSIVLENMLWVLYLASDITDAAGLGKAIETGIKAREAKIKGRGRAGGVDRLGREMLARSSNNLRVFARILG